MINYVTDTCIVINDGYLTRKGDFARVLEANAMRFQASHGYFPLWWENRSMRSMQLEWATHNALYNMGLFRSHTKDVDIEAEQAWWLTAAYYVCGSIALLFIK